MKKIFALVMLLAFALGMAAQDEVSTLKPITLPGKGKINVETLNKRIDTKMDISNLSVSELRVLRNAFAARQGYLFNNSELRLVFNTTSWYDSLAWERVGNPDKVGPLKYTPAEQAFMKKLQDREKELLRLNFKPKKGIVNLDNLINGFQLDVFPEQLKDHLAKYGFGIVEADNEQIFQVYEHNDYTMFPNFVTTDLYLQLFHLYFDTTLRKVEESTLSKVMTDFSKRMYDTMASKAKSAKDAKVKDAAEWLQTYFAIAYTLISGAVLPPVPETYKEMASDELNKCGSSENGYSDFLEYKEVYFAYSLFRPRGHYTRSVQCQRYFRAMMWLQTVPFGTDIEHQMLRAALLAETIASDPAAKKAYDSVSEPVTYLMGAPDNVTILQVADVMKQQGVDAARLAKNKNAMAAFCKRVDEIAEKQTRIRPKFERTSHNKVNLMPQRYQPDAEVLLEMCDYENVPTKRDVPKGLDFMAAMGSTAAERILISELKEDKRWEKFTPTLGQMKTLMQQHTDWNASVATKWMSALDALNKFDDSRLPYFMKTPQWDKKNLNATLASWAELKHDAILYAKQPFAAECGDGSLPAPTVVGYVEPNIAFWEKAVKLLDETNGVLKRYDLLTEEVEQMGEEMKDEAQFFLDISKKELEGKKITNEEYEHIRYIGATFENLSLQMLKEPDQILMGWFDVQGADKSIAVVADVYTANGDNNPEQSILYEGVGPAHEIYVVVEVDGYLRLMRGGVFSYREFKRPVLEPRMTDEEWQEKLKQYPNTGKPSWMEEIIVPIDKKPADNETVFYGSGC
ncbi:MAG: DUF3160 domain-containing protein [Prevotella sp.]|nr:DUF3160 domain-containing protein [Prevotella sp.]